MKQYVFLFAFLFLSIACRAQVVVTDTAYVTRDTIAGVVYFQEVRQVEYDNGQSNITTGERLDSAEFVRRAFRDAHDAMLPVAQATQVLALSGDNRRVHNYYSDILEDVTGQDYSTGVLEGGKFQNYIREYEAVWRVFYDSAGVTKDFYVYYNDSLNVGREILNPAAVIAGSAPQYVVATKDRRIRFFPYESFFARLTLLVRSGAQLVPFYTPLLETRSIRNIVNEAGVDTGRTLWTDANLECRLVRIPIQTPQE